MLLPQDESLFTAAQVRALEQLTLAQGIDGAQLMQRAGLAAFHYLRWCWPRARGIAVVCGGGNNGGDGYVVARLAHEAGLRVALHALTAPTTPQARAMAQRCVEAGIAPASFAAASFTDVDVIVDALLGVGLTRAVAGPWRAAIAAMNASAKPILALDVPSGLDADTGAVRGDAVRASTTMTFIGVKVGMLTGAGPARCGDIACDDLDLPANVLAKSSAHIQRLTRESLVGVTPRRARDAHKGDAGRVLVVGGDLGMFGAAYLCGIAAYRVGAGLVTLATQANDATAVCNQPELIVYGADGERVAALAAQVRALALGPGLGTGRWSEDVWEHALAAQRPLVVDADGLNLLARRPQRRDAWILTPHPGEAARLLNVTSADIQDDRVAAARAIADRYGGVCVLKGAGTIIAAAERLYLCDRGNPGMASGGMGDVLTGVIAGLLAQGLTSIDAARLGVWLHASAGDAAAAQGGMLGLVASDLLAHMRAQLNALVEARS